MAYLNIGNPEYTSTIEQFISYKNDDTISYDLLSFKDKYDNIIYPVMNIIDDYIEELTNLSIKVTLSDSEYLKYRYKPKLLARYIYGNAELDFLILRINGICNMKEFNSKVINLISRDDLDLFLKSVYNANKEAIDIYNSNIY